MTISPIYDDEGQVVAASVVARDIGDRKRTESRLAFLADHDLLTGLFNRRRFDQELAGRSRSPSATTAAARQCVLGLDNFKLVNDTLGHQVGDELIRRVAELLSTKAARSTRWPASAATSSRSSSATGDPEAVARELLETVKAQPLVSGPEPIRITASSASRPSTAPT